jgi:ABC-type nitrate/sulfonate/bicarbonate transport system substrate-binding protein
MMRVRRTLLALLALALVVSAACGSQAQTPTASAPAQQAAATQGASGQPAGRPAEPRVLKMGVPTIDVNYLLPVVIAEAQGYFQEEGVAPQLLEMSTTAGNAALMNGELDLAAGSGAIVAAIQGADARAVFFPYHTSTFLFSVDPARIKQPSDLAGQAIGIASPGNSQDIATRLMLQSLGVDPLSANYIPLGGESARVAALLSGQIVGSANNPNVAAELKRQGYIVIANSYKVMPIPWSGYGANAPALAQRADTFQAWMRGMIKGLQFARQNADASADIVSKAAQIDLDIAKDSLLALIEVMDPDDPGGFTEAGMRQQIQVIRDAAPGMREVTIDDVADVAPLRAAQRSLGIQCKGGYKC